MAFAHTCCDVVDSGAVRDVAEFVLAADLLGQRAQPLLAARQQDAVPAV
jgi:hypothetical protein